MSEREGRERNTERGDQREREEEEKRKFKRKKVRTNFPIRQSLRKIETEKLFFTLVPYNLIYPRYQWSISTLHIQP